MVISELLKSDRAEIQNLSYLPPNILLGSIFTLNWVCLVLHFRLLKRVSKALTRAPKLSTRARRKGTKHSELIVVVYFWQSVFLSVLHYPGWEWLNLFILFSVNHLTVTVCLSVCSLLSRMKMAKPIHPFQCKSFDHVCLPFFLFFTIQYVDD